MKTSVIAALISVLFVSLSANPQSTLAEVEKASVDLNYAQVTYVEAIQNKDSSWCISTTVRHNDEGWDHYANAWAVLDEDENEIAWRTLLHPHDDEQPFTRAQCEINIPEEVTKLIIQAKCTVHGFGGQAVVVDLSEAEGEKYMVNKKKK